MDSVEVKTRRWKRVEYDRLIETGFFHKGSLYARAGLADYWIVNLVDRVLEVYRSPGADPAASFGWRYQSVQTLERGASVSPLALPATRIRVGDLLP